MRKIVFLPIFFMVILLLLISSLVRSQAQDDAITRNDTNEQDAQPVTIVNAPIPIPTVNPAPNVSPLDPNAPETCVDNNLWFTTMPPKCLTNKGRLMFYTGNIPGPIVITKP